METKEYRTVDKAEWGKGPWQYEPDKMQWTDEATGLPCLMHRAPSGALCGYVGVTEGHPWFDKGYDDVPVRVHGGLTFADFCRPGKTEESGICHVPSPGEPDHVYWFGFDCAHYGDVCPAYSRYGGTFVGTGWRESYKELPYLKSEVANLAAQLKALQV